MTPLPAEFIGTPVTLASVGGDDIAAVAIVGGLVLALVGMISRGIRSHAREKEREQSRREIAAYVAEGTMSAEDGAKLLNAGPKHPF